MPSRRPRSPVRLPSRQPARLLASTLAASLAAGASDAAAPQDPQGARGEVFIPAGADNWAFYDHDGWCWIGAFPDAGEGDAARFLSTHVEDFASFRNHAAPALRPCAPTIRVTLCHGAVRETGTHPANTVLAFASGHSRRLVATAGHGRRDDPAWRLEWSGQCAPPSSRPPAGRPDSGSGDGGGSDGGHDGGGAADDGPDKGDNDGDGSGDSGDSGGCFLTTAIVERRGLESDDGPTLTALRRFRDRRMMRDPVGRGLVADYERIAPAIVAAIPPDSPDWIWIAGRIDAAVAAIGAGADAAAGAIYVAMVRRLAARWLTDINPGGDRL